MWITNKPIAIGCDHAGFELKESVKEFLRTQEFTVIDYGTTNKESCDYPDYAHQVGKYVQDNDGVFGIVICGSGNGVNMVVNKYANVRSALCWNAEIASFARLHNNANIIALPARYISVEEALSFVKVFFTTSFEGGRHQVRIDKIPLK